jgi:arabinose-5-phosphate isomerase
LPQNIRKTALENISLIENGTAAAQRTLKIEADALTYMADHLPQDFAGTVSRMLATKGRVIVSGIGKSGHIGRKIAATFASTGTPSYFVHSAEASHGDLGMIADDDICLLISNSGETSELRDIIYHSKRFSIPMVGISSNPDSTLMKAANYRLTLPKMPEACPLGMAPTTSTTLTLALGDALAIALMEARGFMPEDFGVYHPGGKLGAQMKTISEMMHTGDTVPVLDSNATMEDVLLVMTSKGFGIAALTHNGVLKGVITDGDLRRNISGLMSRQPIDIANASPVTVAPEQFAPQALALANEQGVQALLVIDEDRRPIGVVHVHDFLRAGVM